MNWEQFLHMGGYAFYVWTSYGLMAVILIANLIAPLRRKAAILKSLAARQKQEKLKQEMKTS